MSPILFDVARPVVETARARADIACFVGLARAVGAQLPQALQDWLQARGWTDGITSTLAQPVAATDTQIVLAEPLRVDVLTSLFIDQERMVIESIDTTGAILSVDRGAQGTTPKPHLAGALVQAAISQYSRPIGPPFTDIPIPIESYPAFTALFDPGGSPQSYGTDYLAVAVRSFFAQGGRRCYVVVMGDPVSATDQLPDKQNKLASVLPTSLYAPDDRRSWHGLGHLGGLPDVSYLALPDLPVLISSVQPPVPAPAFPPPQGAVVFSECAPAKVPTPAIPAPPPYPPAPRLAPSDYGIWAKDLGDVLSMVQTNFREVQLVAAFPIPNDLDASAATANLLSNELAQDVHDVVATFMPETPGAQLSSTFLQLSYPWLKTSGSGVLSESLEPPDGLLTGLLARNALTRGSFMDATKIVPAELYDVSPVLPDQETLVPSTPLLWNGIQRKPLITRLSLFGFTPLGLRLLSDVTAYPGESYRPARIHRLVSVISRAARGLGEQVIFAQNGPPLWARVERALNQLLMRLWRLNALDGATIQQAFSVRCDQSTMTQNDIDSGRLIAQVTFQAASTIELIRVTLAMETSGATSQASAQLLAEAS